MSAVAPTAATFTVPLLANGPMMSRRFVRTTSAIIGMGSAKLSTIWL